MKEYSMFSPEGDMAVHKIALEAVMLPVAEDRWPAAYRALVQLSKIKGYSEATDTAVRECVYLAVGGIGDFYI
jgi:hypothetical protein